MAVRLGASVPRASHAFDEARRFGGHLLAARRLASCRITVNANRRRVLAWRWGPDPEISVHWALLAAPDTLLRVLDGDRSAWIELRSVLPVAPAPAPARTRGHVHDLAALLEAQRPLLPRPVEATIGWGRFGRAPSRTLRLGSCASGSPAVIRIHPVLDHAEVPAFFVGFVVFHELLHAVFPPLPGATRRVVHPRSFRQAERRHPDHARALAWESGAIGDLLARCRACASTA